MRMFEKEAGFAMALLTVVQSCPDKPIQLSAAIYLKNWIKRCWEVDTDDSTVKAVPIGEGDKTTIKTSIVELMLQKTGPSRALLIESIVLVSEHDFPGQWDSLLPDLASRLKPDQDVSTVTACLDTVHNLCREYPSMFRTDELFTEILYVLSHVQAPLLAIFKHMQNVVATSQDPAVAGPALVALRSVCKVFYCLAYQDLPQAFLDNLHTDWVAGFHQLLTMPTGALESDDDDEAGPVELVQAAVCENLNLFMDKYESEIQSSLQQCVEDIWGLLMRTGLQAKYDQLAVSAINFLTTIARGAHSSIMGNEDILREICEKVVVPNLQCRESDEDLFTDTPLDYIRRDIEGSDTDTRRRAASDLVRALVNKFEGPVTTIFSSFVTVLLQQYASAPSAQWKAKDVAVYLVSALAVKTSTKALGTTGTNQFVDVVDFFKQNVVTDLTSDDVASPILVAGAIKFISVFRNQLPKDVVLAVMPRVVHLLRAPYVVVQSYAGHTIERVLACKDPATNAPVYTAKDVLAFGKDIMVNAFAALATNRENDYVVKAVMRVVVVGQEHVADYAADVIAKLNEILMEIARNPTNPAFNHYLFETVAAFVRFVSPKTGVTKFEEMLFPVFGHIMQNEVVEFMPYVFQLMSQLLELRPANSVEQLPETYVAIFGMLTKTTDLYQNAGNVPALSRLLSAYVLKAGDAIFANADTLRAFLGVIQYLVSTGHHASHAFDLLADVVQNVPFSVIQSQFTALLTVLLTKLQNTKAAKFRQDLVHWFSVVTVVLGPTVLLEAIDSIQARLFASILSGVWLSSANDVKGKERRRDVVVALVRLLSDCPAMLANENYVELWPAAMRTVISMLATDEAAGKGAAAPEAARAEDVYENVEENQGGYKVAFSRLIYAKGPERKSATAAVDDTVAYVATSLGNAAKARPGVLPGLLSKLDAEQTQAVQFMLNRHSIQLA